MPEEIYETDFRALIGAFGTHANPEKRQKAERLAAMKPDDKRRKRGSTKNRERQLNVKVTTQTLDLLHVLCAELSTRDGRKWSQPDIIEEAIAAFANSHKIEGEK